MRKKTKVLLAAIGVLVVVIAGALLLNLNNIMFLKYYIFSSKDDINQLLVENDDVVKTALEKIPEVSIRDLTDKERKAMNEGTLTQTEAIRIILGKQEPLGIGAQNDTVNEADAPSELPEISRLEELLAQVYVLKAQFTNSLDGLKSSASAEYYTLGKEELSTRAKMDFVRKYMQAATNLEAASDAGMNSLITQIRGELMNTGGDVSVADDISAAYANEKNLKKAKYMSLF